MSGSYSMSRFARLGLVVTALALATPFNSAHAASIVNIASDGGNSTSNLGSFTGSISYSADSAFSTTGLLSITLTNTSNAANGGYITGLLFNIASADSNATAAYQAVANDPFSNCSGNGLSGEPFGNPYDAGVALGGSFLGGASPTDGIGVGQTSTFSFLVSASDAGSLEAMDFLTGGPFEFDFLVRFRGFNDGGSDKVPAITTPPNVVPLPAPLAMGAVGLVGAWLGSGFIRRRLQQA